LDDPPQTCTVTNGSGIVGTANVTNIVVRYALAGKRPLTLLLAGFASTAMAHAVVRDTRPW
jgi:hypothetical protein